jgi:hypothetical protein
MDYILVRVFSYSIVPAAILGLIRCRRIDPAYYPFLFLVWLGLIAEAVSDYVMGKGYSNAPSTNIYVLIESLLTVWLFKNLGLFERKPLTFYILGIFFIVVWLIDNFILSGFKSSFCSYFIICFSFAAVMMSVSMINMLIARIKKSLLRNGAFLICVGFILYHTCSALVEIFWVYGLQSSPDFRIAVYRILGYINLVVNLIYALAVLWIPRKHGYLLQS